MIYEIKTGQYISVGMDHYKAGTESVTVFRLAKPDESYKETEKTVESLGDRCVGKIALVLNALIAIEGLLVWTIHQLNCNQTETKRMKG